MTISGKIQKWDCGFVLVCVRAPQSHFRIFQLSLPLLWRGFAPRYLEYIALSPVLSAVPIFVLTFYAAITGQSANSAFHEFFRWVRLECGFEAVETRLLAPELIRPKCGDVRFLREIRHF